MFNVSLYDVSVIIDIHHGDELVARATQRDAAWIEVDVDNATGHFDLLGASQMELRFIDDHYLAFEKSEGSDRVTITVSKSDIGKTVGRMLQYLADTTLSLFERDED